MAPVIPPQTPALANYSFNDVAQGISNVVFCAGISKHQSGTDLILSNSTFYSDPIITKVTYTSNSISNPTELFDLDFDLIFGAPRIINGNIIINVPLGMGDAGGAGARTITLDGQVNIYHVTSGGSETLLGSKNLEAKEKTIGDDTQYAHMYNIRISITNQKFRRGEKLRLNIKGIFRDQSAHQGVAGIGHDPMNRNDLSQVTETPPEDSGCIPDNIDTNLLIQVPFKIDI